MLPIHGGMREYVSVFMKNIVYWNKYIVIPLDATFLLQYFY